MELLERLGVNKRLALFHPRHTGLELSQHVALGGLAEAVESCSGLFH